MFKINQLFYSPVKSLSFSSVKQLEILNNIGIKFDRNFAFTRDLDDNKVDYILNNPLRRQIINFLSLKHFPELNEYNFDFKKNILELKKNNIIILTTNINNKYEVEILCKKIQSLIPKVKKIRLVQDSINPFFDTMPSKTISLINLNSIKDFENKISKEVESQRFRANIYVDGIGAWEERNWVNQIIKINNIDFKVEKNIPRCVAINIKPNTDDNTFNLLQSLKKNFNHFDMGIYLTALNDGEINIENKVEFNK